MIAHSVADQLRLIDRAVTTLTRSTEALLRATDETALLEDICRVVVEVAGYRLAWVGYARDDAPLSVQPVAVAGRGRAYIDQTTVSWGDQPLGHGPTGAAIRTGQAQTCQNIEQDPRFAPWRQQARDHALRSLRSDDAMRTAVAWTSARIVRATASPTGSAACATRFHIQYSAAISMPRTPGIVAFPGFRIGTRTETNLRSGRTSSPFRSGSPVRKTRSASSPAVM